MKLVKLFEFSELPDYVADYIFDLAISLMDDSSLDYGAFQYNIGGYVSEYDSASESDKRGYPIDEINLVRSIDQWFYEQGCEDESVYIIR